MKFYLSLVLVSILPLLSLVSKTHEVLSQSLEIERPGGAKITYYLDQTSADSASSDTLLIILQGSDCNSVKHDNFINLHGKEIWPSADLLMVEKPGITEALPFNSDPERPDCPAAYLQQDSPTQRMLDLKAVVSKVQTTRSYERIITVGGSEGAVVAAMFAAQTEMPAAVILINGGGRWFLDDVLHNMEASMPEGDSRLALEGFRGFAQRVLEGEPFHIDMSGHGYAWWRDVLSIDLQSVISQIRAPVLIVQGGKDQAVSPESVDTMVKYLQEVGVVPLTLLTYAELDHGLSDPYGQSKTGQVVADVVIWLRENLPTSKP